MPHFEDYYASKLRGSLGVSDAEAVLDLREHRASRRRARSGHAAAQPVRPGEERRRGVSGACPKAAATPFQPVGKALLEAETRLDPAAADASGP